ncbi:YabN family protein [Treponema sp. Marseille-Q4130]|uniref:nucleoside triphosphate pyrophosphohydrolase n=1 Tax=Treponema sp. Marseille-Q4130 TaxID=2766702 RepID=UPI001651C8DE|nr:MazG family protein [Treponema sp. Marseille-Q4130]MBC6718949.1 nucleoside triphosphate pyrophosphohydrolase [Treponema sp. Marseille-Q4130]
MSDIQNDTSADKTAAAYKRLYETIRTLRAPGGCPWDREQTPLTMRRDLIEETFEAVDAVSTGDAAHAREELGDVILNASMIAYMYEQQNDFSVAEALDELTDKLIRRHPHVFPQSDGMSEVTEKVTTGEEVLNQWDRIKENVEGRKSVKTILDEVPEGFPPLLRAYKMQKKAAKKGFDWQSIESVSAKVYEELEEVRDAFQALQDAKSAGDTSECGAASDGRNAPPARMSQAERAALHLEEEFGDLLFAVVNYMRHSGVDPETAMDRANRKFYRRFAYVEERMTKAGIPMDGDHLQDEDAFWNDAKKSGL